MKNTDHILKDIKEYLTANTFDVFDNANKYLSPTGLFNYVMEKAISSIISNIMPSNIYRMHINGYIYIHKLPYSLFVPYCCGHSIQRFLIKGLKTPTIYSKPAKHFNTYIDHLYNYLTSMQQYFSGAQSLNAVELYAGPFIRKDGLHYNDVKQEIQRLLFNLNFPSRIGMQTPFTNFTIVLDAPKRMLEEDYAIYAGSKKDTLGTFIDEARLFIRAFSENLYIGDGKGLPFTFPIPTIMTTSKLLYNDPEVFDSIFKTAAYRGSFYWLNTRIVDPDSSFSMCCRINIDRSELFKLYSLSKEYRLLKKDLEDLHEKLIKRIESIRTGGLWALPDITGSIGVVTINLPRIAFESRGNDEKFYEKLETIMNIARECLEWFRYRYFKLAQNYPQIYKMPLEYIPETYRLYNSPFFNTIGVIGLPEAVSILIEDPKLWTEPNHKNITYALKYMEKILKFIVGKTRIWSLEKGYPFNVEEIPGETAAIKLAEKDLKSYPEISKYLFDKDIPFYSNSIVPYYSDLDLADRIEIEAKLQKYFTGGVMMHIFLGEEPDPEALAKLTKRITYNTELIYWSYTPAFSECKKCGWKSTGLYRYCPRCGGDTNVWSRIIGYYRPISNWNPIRKLEFWTRKHYI